MQKLQKEDAQHYFEDAQQRVFELYAPEDDKTGNLSTLLKPADSCAGMAKKCVLMALTNHSFAWDNNAFPFCCLSGFLTPATVKVLRETSGLGGHAVFGLESISGLGSFLAAESSGNSGVDRLYVANDIPQLFGAQYESLLPTNAIKLF